MILYYSVNDIVFYFALVYYIMYCIVLYCIVS